MKFKEGKFCLIDEIYIKKFFILQGQNKRLFINAPKINSFYLHFPATPIDLILKKFFSNQKDILLEEYPFFLVICLAYFK